MLSWIFGYNLETYYYQVHELLYRIAFKGYIMKIEFFNRIDMKFDNLLNINLLYYSELNDDSIRPCDDVVFKGHWSNTYTLLDLTTKVYVKLNFFLQDTLATFINEPKKKSFDVDVNFVQSICLAFGTDRLC